MKLLKRSKILLSITALVVFLSFLGRYNETFTITPNRIASVEIYAENKKEKEENHPPLDEVIRVEINPNSTIAADIIDIVHVPNESKVIVNLQKERRCRQPHLIGRLSGPILTKLEWSKLQQGDNETIAYLDGYYDVSVPGMYYIEIIAIMCEELGYDTDFQFMCLEDTNNHRITRRGSVVNISLPSSNDNNPRHTRGKVDAIGHWYDVRTVPTPLYTRYQPQNCREKKRARSPRCKESTDVSRFNPYQFKFAENISLEERLRDKSGHKVCFVGASHSRMLLHKSLRVFRAHNIMDVKVHHIDNKLVNTTAGEKVREEIINSGCTKVVVGTGQHDAGWPLGAPTLIPAYKEQLETAMSKLLEIFRDKDIDLYFRSTHYNPLGDSISMCPPGDWRSPPVIDMYNQVTKTLCEQFKIPLIETNDIIGVMWDRAKDWCHYDDISGEMEAVYILDRVFADRHFRNQSVTEIE